MVDNSKRKLEEKLLNNSEMINEYKRSKMVYINACL